MHFAVGGGSRLYTDAMAEKVAGQSVSVSLGESIDESGLICRVAGVILKAKRVFLSITL